MVPVQLIPSRYFTGVQSESTPATAESGCFLDLYTSVQIRKGIMEVTKTPIKENPLQKQNYHPGIQHGREGINLNDTKVNKSSVQWSLAVPGFHLCSYRNMYHK